MRGLDEGIRVGLGCAFPFLLPPLLLLGALGADVTAGVHAAAILLWELILAARVLHGVAGAAGDVVGLIINHDLIFDVEAILAPGSQLPPVVARGAHVARPIAADVWLGGHVSPFSLLS